MKSKILLIDDNYKTAKIIIDLLNNSKDFELLFFEKNIDINNIKNSIGFNKFDIIIINFRYINFNYIITNIKLYENLPIIILLENENDANITNAYQSGGWDYISIKNSKSLITYKIKQLLKIKNKIEDLSLKEEILKEYEIKLLTEKKIFTVSLDILAHDTKNIFFNIKTLLNECPNDPIKSLLEDSVNELFEINMEAISFIQNKKRINSLVDIIHKIRVTKDRVFLTDFKRIKLTCGSKYLYFVETSPLIKNAISNLLENSIKYSPVDSIIEIKLERNNYEILINIIDEGIGINEDDKNKIFEEYYRSKKNLKVDGMGLGLFITNNIVEKEGGKLLINNNPNGGTIMTILLPVFKIKCLKDSLNDLSKWFEVPLNKIKEKEENIRTILTINGMDKYNDIDSIIFVNILDILRKERMEINQIHIKQKLKTLKNKNKNSKKVLIIDDSIYVHYYLAVFFTELGFGISDFAFNGNEGIECYKNNKADIITIDYTMPEVNGVDTAKKLFSLNKNIKIIFITAMGDSIVFLEKLNGLIPENNYQILTKPIVKESIIKAVENLL
ncbi:MAG: response regulator [Spirochaetes bacterium]|nr:response regulator [Spirochaetota bacterium]